MAFSTLSVGVWNGVGSFLQSAAGFFQTAQGFLQTAYDMTRVLVHGVVQGALTVAQGGSFLQGFAIGAAGQGAGIGIRDAGLYGVAGDEGKFLRSSIAGVAGGTASVLTGGKFANGAVNAAFAHLFNDEAHAQNADDGRPLTTGEVKAAKDEYPDINTDVIKVKYDIVLTAGAYTPDNTIHFPSQYSWCTDFSTCSGGESVGWLVHELGHVYQYQNGVDPVLGHIFSKDIFNFGNYLPFSGYLKTPTPADLNTEQWADWHKWHYLCTHNLQQGC